MEGHGRGCGGLARGLGGLERPLSPFAYGGIFGGNFSAVRLFSEGLGSRLNPTLTACD